MKTITLLIFIFSLAGCAASGPELPVNDGDSSDTMKRSPCVCNEVPFNSEGYTWKS
ncbi:hypothetical protein [Terasakiella sp. SH-1]|uniref:hypothetical protein n=1 Tax=Terasakiella sp. SH-1 TaxID=2560057 RepID=UPI0014314847|nr:hypothetical protein [Terasakiella sp. SH-1]